MKSAYVAQCPDRPTLERFLASDRQDGSAAAIDSHVAVCSDCQKVISDLLDDQRSCTVEHLLRERAASLLPEPLSSRASGDTKRASLTVPIVEGYQVDRELGRGAYGIVYRAYDPLLDRDVAIKVPHPEIVQSAGGTDLYLSEARAAARLDHPNIVRVFEATARSSDSCYVVSQYINGRSLAECLAAQRPTFAEGVSLLIPLLDALQHSHERGIVHRDVKPANILIDNNSTPFLTDFGLALREQDVGTGPRYLGTPAYMSPEQARGEGHLVDGRADIYSMGVILFKVLTGKRPFQVKSPKQLIEMIATVDAPSARQKDRRIPAELDQVCARALARDIADRYRCASDMAYDLQRCLRRLPDERTIKAKLQHPVRMTRRRILPLATLASMSMALFLAAPSKRNTNTFRIGIKPWVGFSPLIVAKQLRLCGDLRLEFVPVLNTTDVRGKILSKELDAAPYLVDSHAIARANRTPTKAVLLLDVSLQADAMVATSRIKSLSDVRGKRVAYMHHEAPHFLLLSLCEMHGIDIDDFQHVKVETAKQAAERFVAGEVDAVVTYEPFVQLALSRSGSHRLASAADDLGSIIDILTVREDVLEKQPNQVSALIAGWLRAVELLRQRDPSAIRIACEFLGNDHGPMTTAKYHEMAQGMRYGSSAENIAFFRTGTSGVNEFQCRMQAAQQRWHRHHQLPRITRPADGDGSSLFLDLYAQAISSTDLISGIGFQPVGDTTQAESGLTQSEPMVLTRGVEGN